MAESPVLPSARLRLVPFGEPFLTERYLGWLNDPEVMRFSQRRYQRHTRESALGYLAGFSHSPHYFWAIVRNDGERPHIGNIAAHVDPAHGLADISILVGERDAWGAGYGTEAWRTVCEFLLRDLRMRKVTGGTLASNAGMLRIMQRCGMQDDGRRKRHYLVDGASVDVVYMALFNDADA